ncbi:MAG: SDR family NAD(P)-dependent oxidoreductase [Rubricoccaceae bacterium]|nr:SDR family NAD(P)-dependent oxidoreductase [Rubricoccaceae bacterium]
MELDGRVALITGGGSGIGKATAVRFAAEGARVAVLSRTKSELDRTVREIEDAGGEGLAVVADVSRPEGVEQAVQAVEDRWGRLDIVFANAGVNGVWAPVDELAPEEWEHTVAVNLHGTFYTLHYAVPLLKRQGGAVLITASINGTRRFTGAGASAYAATKAAQVALAKILALELAKHAIRVNVICPGAIDTKIEENTERRDTEEAAEPVEYPAGDIPLTDGAPGTADDVAQLALFLVSDRARHITGTPVWIDGAESLLQG